MLIFWGRSCALKPFDCDSTSTIGSAPKRSLARRFCGTRHSLRNEMTFLCRTGSKPVQRKSEGYGRNRHHLRGPHDATETARLDLIARLGLLDACAGPRCAQRILRLRLTAPSSQRGPSTHVREGAAQASALDSDGRKSAVKMTPRMRRACWPSPSADERAAVASKARVVPSGSLTMRPPHDTTPAAHEAQLRAYRRMAPERRAEISLELSDAIRTIAREGIRRRHPEYSGADVSKALVVLLYGLDVARRVWPDGGTPLP
jgi:hypothetical protein